MLTLNQLRTYFWNIDPGYFNLKHAFKTILAILISLWLVRDEAMLTKVIAGIASGASMQGVGANTLLPRIAHVVIFDIIYFAALALGFLIHNSPLWTAISLVVLGFIVNYMRRFGLDNSMAPMIAWVLCFLATILPITDAMSPWVLGLGILVGFLVSGIVGIFIFPENYPHLFVSNSNRFFQNLAKGIHGMRQHVLVDNRATDFINLPFMSSKVTLDQLLESNQAIQSSTVFTKDQKIISHVLMHQYALLNAYFLMSDVYYSLSSHQIKLPRSATRALSHLNKEFAHLFSTIRVGADYSVYRDKPHYVLSTFSDKLGRISLTEPVAIMALLNFKLSFDMLNQHVAELLRGYNDA